MQSLRSTTNAEIKKREKEVERMAERWSKLSDSQMKLGGVRSGMTMTCANVQALEGREVGKGLVDAALEEAEDACKRLREENTEVKALVVDVANAVQKILHKATSQDPDDFDYVRFLCLHLIPSTHCTSSRHHLSRRTSSAWVQQTQRSKSLAQF
jgi:hypothetical protein